MRMSLERTFVRSFVIVWILSRCPIMAPMLTNSTDAAAFFPIYTIAHLTSQEKKKLRNKCATRSYRESDTRRLQTVSKREFRQTRYLADSYRSCELPLRSGMLCGIFVFSFLFVHPLPLISRRELRVQARARCQRIFLFFPRFPYFVYRHQKRTFRPDTPIPAQCAPNA